MFKKILLAYDGATGCAAALREAADLARLGNAELHLLGIVVTSGYMALAEGVGAVDIWGMEHARLKPALAAAVAELAAQGITANAAIREGDPGAEITACARAMAADLVVLGHGRKGWVTRWLEGSVGAQVLSDMPCCLLIVSKES